MISELKIDFFKRIISFFSKFIFFLITFHIACFLFLNYASASSENANITVDFMAEELSECISTILKLSNSTAKISIDKNVEKKITKKAVNLPWNDVLKEILLENELRLVKLDNIYTIINNTEAKDSGLSNIKTNVYISNESNNSDHISDLKNDCDHSQLITLGYQFSTGVNPYALIGKCIKLKNVTAIQYFDAREAIVQWNYRGGQGVVFLESKTNELIFGDGNSLIAKSVDVYKYQTVTGAEMQIPYLVIE